MVAYLIRHPAVAGYISESLSALRGILEEDGLSSLTIAVLRADNGKVLSRYVIILSICTSATPPSAKSLGALETELQGHLARLYSTIPPSLLHKESEDVELTFDIIAEARTPGVARAPLGWSSVRGRDERRIEGHNVAVEPIKDAVPRREGAAAHLQTWIECAADDGQNAESAERAP